MRPAPSWNISTAGLSPVVAAWPALFAGWGTFGGLAGQCDRWPRVQNVFLVNRPGTRKVFLQQSPIQIAAEATQPRAVRGCAPTAQDAAPAADCRGLSRCRSDSGIGRSHRAAKAAATSGSPRLAKVNPCVERAHPRVAKTLVRELNCYRASPRGRTDTPGRSARSGVFSQD